MSENNEYITVKEYAKRQGVGKSTVNRKIAAGLLSFIKVKGSKRVKADDPCINPRTGSNKIKDLTGQKFHYLTVISFVELRKQRAYWLCQCDCSRINIVGARQLKTGDIKSCGCYKNDPGVQARRIQTWEKYYIDGVAIPRLTSKIGSNNTSGKKGGFFR